MSEQALSPQQQKETAYRILHDAELIQHGASINSFGRLVITESQYDKLHAEMPLQEPGVALADLHAESAEAKRQGIEQLREVANTYGFFFSGWFVSGSIPRSKSEGAGFQMLRSESVPWEAKSLIDNQRTSDEFMAAFAETGVSELITFVPSHKEQGRSALHLVVAQKPDAIPEAEKIESSVIMIYETVTRGEHSYRGKLYEYSKLAKDGYGRPGNYFYGAVVLSESKATEMRAVIERNPTVVHELMDTIMTENLSETQSDWDKCRPPYDKWREMDGGVSRIAVRDSFQQRPMRDQIIEY